MGQEVSIAYDPAAMDVLAAVERLETDPFPLTEFLERVFEEFTLALKRGANFSEPRVMPIRMGQGRITNVWIERTSTTNSPSDGVYEVVAPNPGETGGGGLILTAVPSPSHEAWDIPSLKPQGVTGLRVRA